MREEPTLPEKIAEITDAAELIGFREQLQKDGRLDPRLDSLIKLRSHELKTINGWEKSNGQL